MRSLKKIKKLKFSLNLALLEKVCVNYSYVIFSRTAKFPSGIKDSVEVVSLPGRVFRKLLPESLGSVISGTMYLICIRNQADLRQYLAVSSNSTVLVRAKSDLTGESHLVTSFDLERAYKFGDFAPSNLALPETIFHYFSN